LAKKPEKGEKKVKKRRSPHGEGIPPAEADFPYLTFSPGQV
jgi:hypothetical protein